MHVYNSNFPLNSKHVISFLLQYVELSKIVSKKMTSYFFSIHRYETVKRDVRFSYFGMCIVHTFFLPYYIPIS